MLNYFLKDPHFIESSPYKTISDNPISFVDVGARGGVHDIVDKLAEKTSIIAFEPDSEEFIRLNKEIEKGHPYSKLIIESCGLYNYEGKSKLFLLSAPTNHSLKNSNPIFTQRYDMPKFAQVGHTEVDVNTLDNVIFEKYKEDKFAGEFIKLDTQGTEFEILEGAKRTLSERTVAVVTEVSFCQIYEDQKLFSDIELFLRGFGFSFYGFTSNHERSCRQLDKTKERGRERAFYADAVFFKDPLSIPNLAYSFSERMYHTLFCSAILLEYYDFALELALRSWAVGKEADIIQAFVHKIAVVNPLLEEQNLKSLIQKMSQKPEYSLVELGHFIDERKKWCNYDDIIFMMKNKSI